MSKNKKNMPNPVGKNGPSTYQSGKSTITKVDVAPNTKKHK